MVGGDSRRVVNYSELWDEAGSGAAASASKDGSHPSPKHASTSSVSNNGWSKEGNPQSASTSRKLRKIVTTINGGDIETAERELSKLGSARNNFEIQRALARAKKRRAEGVSFGEEGEGDLEEGYDEGEGGDWNDDDSEMVDGAFDWQGAMGGNQGSSGRQLTHAEIWDDSALVDAWNAAEEEYKLFHARRSAQEKAKDEGQSDAGGVAGQGKADRPTKRSALWHDSPAKGSQAAVAAKTALEEQKLMKRELEERKKKARALLAQVAEGEEQAGEQSVKQPVELENATSKRRKLKGTTPPSSSLSGNLAWHSACATISKTPNAIGPTDSDADGSKLGEGAPTIEIAASHPASSEPAATEDVFQNLAMAWYYAGYYQAMAAARSTGQ